MMPFLTDNFANAKESCKNSGQAVDDHFPRVGKMVELAKGKEKVIV